ncbi:MAG: VCBS repeat-containing protein [Phycisphaerales bacterium]|nr:VCBS repeat-containing protein [Phycisphaerales bacterium]
MNPAPPKLFQITLVFLALLAPSALAQSFPIVPLSQPNYPSTDPAFENFDIDRAQNGTMQRLGDINNDGLDDLVVMFNGNYFDDLINNDLIWMFLRNEEGTFEQPYPLHFDSKWDHEAQNFILLDYNFDGLTDIIIVTEDLAFIYLATQDGFVSAEYLQLDHHHHYPKVQYTDTNADGYSDLVIWSPSELSLDIRLNVADEGFIKMPVPEYDINSNSHEHSDIRFSDFDADGDIDILMIAGYELYLIEKSNGFYKAPIPWTFNLTDFSEDDLFVFADVNADGLEDLVINGRGPNGNDSYGFLLAPFVNAESRDIPFFDFPEFENDRSRDFTRPDIWRNTLYSPGDLDGDGTDDLILKPYEDSDIAWRITDPLNHNGRFGVSNEINIHGDGKIERSIYPDTQHNNSDIYLDINNDNALDRIVVASTRQYVPLEEDDLSNDHHGIMLWATLGNPFMPGSVFSEQDSLYASDVTHITHADINYDGEPDILITRQTNSITTLRKDPNGNLKYERFNNVSARFNDSRAGFRTIVAQLDNDDRTDILSQNLSTNGVIPAIFTNIDVPNFGEQYLPSSLNFQTDFKQLLEGSNIVFSSNNTSFDVGDIDSDGDNDIIIRGTHMPTDGSETESVLVWLNDGDANFTPGPVSPIQPYIANFNVHMIKLLDHDHDGDLDLISFENESQTKIIAIYENDGNGNFTPSIQIPIHEYSNDNLIQYWIETDDLDLDGFEDIQVLMKGSFNKPSEVVVCYGSPLGMSIEPSYFAGLGAAEVYSADLDANGLPDLFTCNYESGAHLKNSISVMFQTAPREFLPAISINDVDMPAIDALDINQDGALDLIGASINQQREFLRVIYSVPQPCPVDFNLDDRINFFDISIFSKLLAEQRPLADLNNDGRYNFFDISTFISAYEVGCP